MQPIYRNHAFITVEGNGRGRSNAYIKGSGIDVGADIFHRGLCLPSDNKMTVEEQEVIIEIMQFVMCFSIGGAFGLCAIANDLVPWYYGNAFIRCALFTMWLSPVVVLTSWNNVIRTQFVIPKGLDKLYLITVSSGAIVNLILNAIFIRIYHGIGAVIATLIAQTVVCVVQFILTKKYLDFKVYIKDSWAFLIAGALMMTAVQIISRAVAYLQ